MNCYATFVDHLLTIGNAHIERAWRWRDGRLLAVSFVDKRSGKNWIAKQSDVPSLHPGEPAGGEPAFSARRLVDGPVESESLVVELTLADRILRFKTFPDSASVTMQLVYEGESAAAEASDQATASGIEEADAVPKSDALAADTLDCFFAAPLHLRLTAVTLIDRTDHHDNLVHETSWLLTTAERRMGLRGNLFILEDTLRGDGLVFLKLAPLPHARPAPTAVDLQAQGADIRLLGRDYPLATIAYIGGRIGRIQAIQQYQRQCRGYVPGRDGVLLSNTWGDRNKDGRICESFMEQEIAAGAKLGVDVVQIDDGWQRGATANSVKAGGVWNGYWAADEHFWRPHETRFPNGLAGLASQAKRHGMRLGLWYGPDSSNHFANWRRDADTLLELHRTLGVCHFKLDSIKMTSRQSEQNLRRLIDALLTESHGVIACDLDVTAEIRPAYFGLMQAGPIFVENRYTDWRRYWPHTTLRNLWQLAHHIDPLRLRMEFLNHTRNADKYANDPLGPAQYRADYLFATVMFSSPLGWFETSNLPADYVEQVAPLIKLWRQHRDEIFAGPIVPIGDEPTGSTWTGFAGRSHVLIFRERNASATREFELPGCDGMPQVIAGRGEVSHSNGRLRATIARELDFVWLRFPFKNRSA